MRRAPCSTLFPYTTLFRSHRVIVERQTQVVADQEVMPRERELFESLAGRAAAPGGGKGGGALLVDDPRDFALTAQVDRRDGIDRKSTRLNSSHANISYAVF